MTTTGPEAVLPALAELRERLARARFPLELPGSAQARRTRRELVAQLDDYVLPRLRRLDAPLLAVVGGSTGAGKSTLVNSLVGRAVSEAGVLRPTTRAPVLVHHPRDAAWFADQRILPGLARVTGAGGGDPGTLRLVAAETVPRGLALLDAPDIDSVVRENRELAAQLLAAADLWVFVTTAARYADAVPWQFLREAAARGAALAVVLDRVPPPAAREIRAHLAEMLAGNGLGAAPLFVVPESVSYDGVLRGEAITPLRDWVRGLAADARSRADVLWQTLEGVLASFGTRVPALADHLDEQEAALATLRGEVAAAYAEAVRRVDEAMRDGSLLRGEVLARWQEFVGTGELLRTLESRIGRLRDQLVAAVTGRPQPAAELAEALETGVSSLVRAAADAAAERVGVTWRATPGGAALLATASADPTRSAPDLPERTERMVRDWQGGVLELVRREAADRRSGARLLSYGVNAAGLVVMIAVFAHTGGLTGGEVAVAGGTSALGQKLLEAILGDQAVRDLAAAARADLRERVDLLMAGERARYAGVLADAGAALAEVEGEDLRAAVAAVGVGVGR